MSISIRVVCRSSLGDVTPEALSAGLVERLPKLANQYGEEGAAETAKHVAITRKKGSGDGFDVFELRWRSDQQKPVRIERRAEERAEEELGELNDWLESYMAEEEGDDGVEEIAHALQAAEEIVMLELSSSDTEGMGWPVAMAVAHYLAETGDGIVRAEGEGWLAPEEGELRHVLEAD